MDIGRVLKDSWVLFTKDWIALVVGALIAYLLGLVTIGIVAVPLFAGVYLMVIRRVREGRKAEIGDVFATFNRFGDYFVAFLVFVGIALVVVVVVGAPLLLLVVNNTGVRAVGVLLTVLLGLVVGVVGIYLGTLWVYGLVLMVDRQRTIIPALKESREIVRRSGFWMTLLMVIIVGAIGSAVSSVIGTVTAGIGSILVVVIVPWQLCAYVSMYLQATGEAHLLPSAVSAAPGGWQGAGQYGAPSTGAYGQPPAAPYGQPQPPVAPYGPPPQPPAGYGPPPQSATWMPPTAPPPWSQAAPPPPPAPVPEAAPPAPGAAPPEAAPEAEPPAQTATPAGDEPTPPTPPAPPAPPA